MLNTFVVSRVYRRITQIAIGSIVAVISSFPNIVLAVLPPYCTLPPGVIVPPVLSPSVGPAVELNTLWEIRLGTDYASTVGSVERDANPPFVGLFYIPTSSTDLAGKALPGVQTLYRILGNSGADHFDSTTAGEGGNATEGPLGYVWSKGTSEFGLSPLIRMYNTTQGSPNFNDHATAVEVSPIPQPPSPAQTFTGYSPEGPIGYGYARYPGTDVVFAWQSGGGVTVKSNLATGCAIWEWWWHGNQFVNDMDYGRQMQIAMYPMDGSSALGEAGDSYGEPGHPVDTRHPSPCVTYSAGVSASGPYMTTAAVPLEWDPSCLGGSPDNPIIYPAVRLGKTITLDWIGPDGIDRNWPVALFQTTINSPPINPAVVEAPTGYLNSNFNNFYYYNPATQALTSVALNDIVSVSGTSGYDVPLSASGPQAVIVASGTDPTSPAMAIYINNPNSGFVFYAGVGGTDGQAGTNFSKWEARYYAPITAGGWTYNTWVMTDTMQNVLSYLNQLYAWGVTSR